MAWNLEYLDAVGVPRWVLRDTESSLDEVSQLVALESDANNKTAEQPLSVEAAPSIKALVNNPEAKLAILVDEQQSKAELQKIWKQLKFAWKQWQNQEFPASLFQINEDSNYSLTKLEQKPLIILDCCNQSSQPQKLKAPKSLQEKKEWWQLLQQAHEKLQLL